jgi:hypothetical protein
LPISVGGRRGFDLIFGSAFKPQGSFKTSQNAYSTTNATGFIHAGKSIHRERIKLAEIHAILASSTQGFLHMDDKLRPGNYVSNSEIRKPA